MTPHLNTRSARAIAAATLAGGIGAAAIAFQLTPAGATAAPVAIKAVPSAIASTIPAFKSALATPIPASLTAIFATPGEGGSPDPTANVALARPITAKAPGAPTNWVIPTQSGACLAIIDEFNSISIGCNNLAEIKAGQLTFETHRASTDGKAEQAGYRIGVGVTKAQSKPDGSFAQELR